MPREVISLMLTIRLETPADHSSVRMVNEQAFARTTEADLVDALREATEPHLSLVAEDEGAVIGHIFFSPVTVASTSGSNATLFGLAPMAVLPERQRQGIGGALVQKGLQKGRELGWDAVVVLGYPDYYSRLGFKPAQVFGLQSEFDVPAEAFMAQELVSGALEKAHGTVRYNSAFTGME